MIWSYLSVWLKSITFFLETFSGLIPNLYRLSGHYIPLHPKTGVCVASVFSNSKKKIRSLKMARKQHFWILAAQKTRISTAHVSVIFFDFQPCLGWVSNKVHGDTVTWVKFFGEVSSHLGGGFKHVFKFHPHTCKRFPFWLIFFRWFETTN